jgi:hypothetical protein
LSGAGGIIALDDREEDVEIAPTNETIQWPTIQFSGTYLR